MRARVRVCVFPACVVPQMGFCWQVARKMKKTRGFETIPTFLLAGREGNAKYQTNMVPVIYLLIIFGSCFVFCCARQT